MIQLGFKSRQADSKPSLFTSIPYCRYGSFIKSMSHKTSGVISQPSNSFEELRALFHGSEKKCHEVVLKSLSCGWQAGRDNRPLSVAPRRDLRKWTTDGDLLLFLPKFQFITYTKTLIFLQHHCHSATNLSNSSGCLRGPSLPSGCCSTLAQIQF